MNNTDPIKAREISTVKLAMQVSGAHTTPAGRAAHIADATGSEGADDQKAQINAILVVLENLGFVATS